MWGSFVASILSKKNTEPPLHLVHVDFAYKDLSSIGTVLLHKYGQTCKRIDLSHNMLQKVDELGHFPLLEVLILDGNRIDELTTFPRMEKLHTLWVNRNRIKKLTPFIDAVGESCPNLKHFSMLNNDACPNYFNGGTAVQYRRYRHRVCKRLVNLTVLDDQPVTKQERENCNNEAEDEESDEGSKEQKSSTDREKRRKRTSKIMKSPKKKTQNEQQLHPNQENVKEEVKTDTKNLDSGFTANDILTESEISEGTSTTSLPSLPFLPSVFDLNPEDLSALRSNDIVVVLPSLEEAEFLGRSIPPPPPPKLKKVHSSSSNSSGLGDEEFSSSSSDEDEEV